MIDEIRQISSTKKDLHNFAVVMATASAVLTGFLFWRQKELWIVFGVAAAVFVILRFTFPIVLMPLQKVWMTLAVTIGWFMSRIILSILFFVVFTTIGGIGRLLGKRFLEVDIEKERESYWMPVGESGHDKSRYEKQF